MSGPVDTHADFESPVQELSIELAESELDLPAEEMQLDVPTEFTSFSID